MPTVVQLKETLRARGLPVTGAKAELEQRLADNDKENQQPAATLTDKPGRAGFSFGGPAAAANANDAAAAAAAVPEPAGGAASPPSFAVGAAVEVVGGQYKGESAKVLSASPSKCKLQLSSGKKTGHISMRSLKLSSAGPTGAGAPARGILSGPARDGPSAAGGGLRLTIDPAAEALPRVSSADYPAPDTGRGRASDTALSPDFEMPHPPNIILAAGVDGPPSLDLPPAHIVPRLHASPAKSPPAAAATAAAAPESGNSPQQGSGSAGGRLRRFSTLINFMNKQVGEATASVEETGRQEQLRAYNEYLYNEKSVKGDSSPRRTSKKVSKFQLQQIFATVDIDGNGTLDKDELRDILKNIKQGEVTDIELESEMNDMNTSGNGEATFGEFLDYFERHRADGGGVIGQFLAAKKTKEESSIHQVREPPTALV